LDKTLEDRRLEMQLKFRYQRHHFQCKCHVEFTVMLVSTVLTACAQDGYDCLHLAAANGHHKLVKQLLSHGADPTTRNAV